LHKSTALSGIVQSGILLREMPLEELGFGVQPLWNRYHRPDPAGTPEFRTRRHR